MMRLERNAVPLALLLAGFVLWSLAFVVLYGMQATGCRLGWDSVALMGWISVQRAVLVLVFLGFLAAHFGLYLALRGQRQRVGEDTSGNFSRKAGAQLALAALGAAVFCFAGVFWLSAC